MELRIFFFGLDQRLTGELSNVDSSVTNTPRVEPY